MSWINEHGFSIYLKQPVEVLFKRLKQDRDERPLLKGLSDKELSSYITNELDERAPYYDQADIVYEGDHTGLNRLVEEIDLLQVSDDG